MEKAVYSIHIQMCKKWQIHHVDYSSDDVAFRNKLYTYLKTCWILNQIRCAYKIVKIA